MTKRSSKNKHINQKVYRNRKSKRTSNGRLDRALIPLLVPILSNPVIIFGCLALASLFFLWKLRRRENISNVVFFNILAGCLVYLALGFLAYFNGERAESERILSFIYLNFSQEQGFLAFLLAFGIIFFAPTILSLLIVSKRNYINRKAREQQEQQRIHTEQKKEIQRLQAESQKIKDQQEQQRVHADQDESLRLKAELKKVLVSTDREDYIIREIDYKKGNGREHEYRKKYVLRLFSLYQNQCAKCGRQDNGYEIDHFFISKNEGGNFSLHHKDGYFVNNAILLCRSCNSSKSDKPYNAFFSDEEILYLFTKNREMTLLLNQISSPEHLQLEIQGILPEEAKSAIMTDEDEDRDLTEFQDSSSEPKGRVLKEEEERQAGLAAERLKKEEGKPQQIRQQQAAQDDLSSEKGIDYIRLRDLLKAGKWSDAERETYEVMICAVDKKSGQWFTSEELLNFPCVDLRTVDELWVKYSQGQFGFSVQKEIYVECGAQIDGQYPGYEIWNEFCSRIGWHENGKEQNFNDLNAQYSSSPTGKFPCALPVRWGWGKGFPSLTQRLMKCSTSQF